MRRHAVECLTAKWAASQQDVNENHGEHLERDAGLLSEDLVTKTHTAEKAEKQKAVDKAAADERLSGEEKHRYARSRDDLLSRALIKRTFDGVACYGLVRDIVQGEKSGERLYFVDHLTADQVWKFADDVWASRRASAVRR